MSSGVIAFGARFRDWGRPMKRRKTKVSPEGDSPLLEELPPWEGPEGTLFLYSAPERRWYISAADGSEALVPARDLRRFVAKCIAARRPR